jgi:hypothetical protein
MTPPTWFINALEVTWFVKTLDAIILLGGFAFGYIAAEFVRRLWEDFTRSRK